MKMTIKWKITVYKSNLFFFVMSVVSCSDACADSRKIMHTYISIWLWTLTRFRTMQSVIIANIERAEYRIIFKQGQNASQKHIQWGRILISAEFSLTNLQQWRPESDFSFAITSWYSTLLCHSSYALLYNSHRVSLSLRAMQLKQSATEQQFNKKYCTAIWHSMAFVWQTLEL